MECLMVRLLERSYPICVEKGALERAGALVREYAGDGKCVVVTDTNVGPLYLARTENALRSAGLNCASLTLPAGEATKCLEKLTEIYDFLCAEGITRKDTLVALGGGVMAT